MAQATSSQQTQGQQSSFRTDLAHETRVVDFALMTLVPVVLVAVYALPRGMREDFTFDITAPSLTSAYVSHFVHLDGLHLLGNLTVYLPAVLVAYLLCALSDRRQLFRITFVTLLVAFPFALSAMQLAFPRERFVFGFSGINAGFVGLASFALTGYIGATISERADERYAPALLFFAVGLIALISVPSRGFRLEIGAAAIGLGLAYIGIALYRQGAPSRQDVREAMDNPGYFEVAGAGFGLLVGYPFVAFQDVVVPGSGLIDVYVHLLGFSLAFIVVFAFVFVIDDE
jgi:hypothetical protein